MRARCCDVGLQLSDAGEWGRRAQPDASLPGAMLFGVVFRGGALLVRFCLRYFDAGWGQFSAWGVDAFGALRTRMLLSSQFAACSSDPVHCRVPRDCVRVDAAGCCQEADAGCRVHDAGGRRCRVQEVQEVLGAGCRRCCHWLLCACRPDAGRLGSISLERPGWRIGEQCKWYATRPGGDYDTTMLLGGGMFTPGQTEKSGNCRSSYYFFFRDFFVSCA